MYVSENMIKVISTCLLIFSFLFLLIGKFEYSSIGHVKNKESGKINRNSMGNIVQASISSSVHMLMNFSVSSGLFFQQRGQANQPIGADCQNGPRSADQAQQHRVGEQLKLTPLTTEEQLRTATVFPP